MMHEINIRTYLMYKINSINMGIDDFTIRNFRNFMFNDVYRYFEEKQIGNEYIYESKIGRINEYMCIIRVYSSIDTKSDGCEIQEKMQSVLIYAINTVIHYC